MDKCLPADMGIGSNPGDYGDAFAEMVNAQEPQLRIQPRNTKGSTENVPLLEAGKVDLALVAGEIATAALSKPGTTLRIVTAMYSSPGMFMVRADSPYRTIADLRDRPVVLGTQASGITALGRTVLRSLEIPVKEITLEKAADGPPMLLDGRRRWAGQPDLIVILRGFAASVFGTVTVNMPSL